MRVYAFYILVSCICTLFHHILSSHSKKCNKQIHRKQLTTPKRPKWSWIWTNRKSCIQLDQQYADDISWASTNKIVLEKIETIIPEVLKERNLFVNKSKTEKYTVSRNQHEWKDCKLVGSKLETVNDIENRIKLVNYSYSTLKSILSQKECKADIKLSIFSALIESIFLYNWKYGL